MQCGREYDCAAAGAWFDDDNLMIYVYSIDNYLGTIKMHIHFSPENIVVRMSKFAEWFFDRYEGLATGYAVK